MHKYFIAQVNMNNTYAERSHNTTVIYDSDKSDTPHESELFIYIYRVKFPTWTSMLESFWEMFPYGIKGMDASFFLHFIPRHHVLW